MQQVEKSHTHTHEKWRKIGTSTIAILVSSIQSVRRINAIDGCTSSINWLKSKKKRFNAFRSATLGIVIHFTIYY